MQGRGNPGPGPFGKKPISKGSKKPVVPGPVHLPSERSLSGESGKLADRQNAPSSRGTNWGRSGGAPLLSTSVVAPPSAASAKPEPSQPPSQPPPAQPQQLDEADKAGASSVWGGRPWALGDSGSKLDAQDENPPREGPTEWADETDDMDFAREAGLPFMSSDEGKKLAESNGNGGWKGTAGQKPPPPPPPQDSEHRGPDSWHGNREGIPVDPSTQTAEHMKQAINRRQQHEEEEERYRRERIEERLRELSQKQTREQAEQQAKEREEQQREADRQMQKVLEKQKQEWLEIQAAQRRQAVQEIKSQTTKVQENKSLTAKVQESAKKKPSPPLTTVTAPASDTQPRDTPSPADEGRFKERSDHEDDDRRHGKGKGDRGKGYRDRERRERGEHREDRRDSRDRERYRPRRYDDDDEGHKGGRGGRGAGRGGGGSGPSGNRNYSGKRWEGEGPVASKEGK